MWCPQDAVGPRINRFIDPFWLSSQSHLTSRIGPAPAPRMASLATLKGINVSVDAGPIHILGSICGHVGNVLHYHSLVSAVAPLGKHQLLWGHDALLLVHTPLIVDVLKEILRLVWVRLARCAGTTLNSSKTTCGILKHHIRNIDSYINGDGAIAGQYCLQHTRCLGRCCGQ